MIVICFITCPTLSVFPGLSLVVLPNPGVPLQVWHAQHALTGVRRAPSALTRLVMAMAKMRRMVAVPRAIRSPGRVATRPDSAGSQCSILGPFKTHLCGGSMGVLAMGWEQVVVRAPVLLFHPTAHLTVRCSEKQTKRRRKKRRKVML